MRIFSTLFLSVVFFSTMGWETDFSEAQQKARKDHKLILLNFSGSDWCGPCIRMHSTIFEDDGFKNFAEGQLVLIKADFPRLKKNQLSKEQQAKNDKLADRFNPNGIFPLTVLLDEEGKMIKSWEGLPPLTATQFTAELKKLTDARH